MQVSIENLIHLQNQSEIIDTAHDSVTDLYTQSIDMNIDDEVV